MGLVWKGLSSPLVVTFALAIELLLIEASKKEEVSFKEVVSGVLYSPEAKDKEVGPLQKIVTEKHPKPTTHPPPNRRQHSIPPSAALYRT
jgi:hypothetical protein